MIWLVDGEFLRLRANFGVSQTTIEYARLHPERPGPGTCTGRVALTKKPAHIPDVDADPDYTYPAAERRHYRTFGAGVAVGHATLGRIGFEGRYDYGALGSVTNLAARLSDAASSGRILLSQRAHAALEGRVEAKPVADLQMKGFARSLQAYELLRVYDDSAG